MARKHDKPAEVVAKLRQVEILVGQGKPLAEEVWATGVTEATYNIPVACRVWRLEAGPGEAAEAVGAGERAFAACNG